ncbi:MAG TPA: chemotaxis protein CheD [Halanaerobiales bacterium]|nr:chemotaxis protein CheD [Halanaerobiales bacterium]
MNNDEIRIKMAEYTVSKPPHVLVTLGLGSCIGLALYDKYLKVGGLIHFMLPYSNGKKNTAKYADSGIPFLIEEMVKIGARKRNIVAKIVGGAKMFNFGEENSAMNIGKRNSEAAKEILKTKSIKIVGEDIGEDFGRTMRFYTESGKVKVTSYKREDLII